MSFKHSYSDLEKSTKLDQNFIRRIMREVPGLRDRHTEKGRDGALFFDDNAVIVLQQAAQLRAQKKSFKLITKLVSDSVTDHQKQVAPTNEPQENKLIKDLVNRLEDSHKATLTAHQEIIRQLEQRILLLTDGKDPGEVRREREQEQARLIALERDKAEAEQTAKNAADTARDLMRTAKVKQEALELEQARLKAELESKQAETKAQEQVTREKATKRAVLLDQLDLLSWFQWGRKRELLTQIRELD